jgi:hypothetical protein
MILVLCLALACSAQLACTTITCGTNTAPYCYIYNTATTSAVSSKCSSGTYCPFSYSATTVNYQCTAEGPTPVTYNALPGEKCNTTNQCITETTCSSSTGLCVGLTLNTPCSSTNVCNPGLYCKASSTTVSSCQNLLVAGAVCNVYTDYCIYGYECNFGTCQKILSTPSGTHVDYALCSLGGYSFMCRYGECYDTNTTHSLCINPIVNNLAYNEPCTTCEGTGITLGVTYTRTGDCACGLGGKSYCPGFGGDEYGSKAFELAREYYLSSDIAKCNVAAGLRCMKDHWDSDDYWEYQYYNWLSSERWKYIGAEECAYQNLDAFYTTLKNEYDNAESSSSDSSSDSSSSGAETLVLSAFVLSLVA